MQLQGARKLDISNNTVGAVWVIHIPLFNVPVSDANKFYSTHFINSGVVEHTIATHQIPNTAAQTAFDPN